MPAPGSLNRSLIYRCISSLSRSRQFMVFVLGNPAISTLPTRGDDYCTETDDKTVTTVTVKCHPHRPSIPLAGSSSFDMILSGVCDEFPATRKRKMTRNKVSLGYPLHRYSSFRQSYDSGCLSSANESELGYAVEPLRASKPSTYSASEIDKSG